MQTTPPTLPQNLSRPPMPTPGRPESASDNTRDNFLVGIRVRPPLARETKDFGREFEPTVTISSNSLRLRETAAVLMGPGAPSADPSTPADLWSQHDFSYDFIYGPSSTQAEVYSAVSGVVGSVLAGYNGSVLAYGQTGSGKTFTMEGLNMQQPQQLDSAFEVDADATVGVIPRAIAQIFAHIKAETARAGGTVFLVRSSYLQIYNETVQDLLEPSRTNLSIRRGARNGDVEVQGITEFVVRDPGELTALILRGQRNRATAPTRMNIVSSRSHAVLTIIVETRSPAGEVTIGKLNLVDLAGSERVRDTGAEGARLGEAAKINLSLSTLGAVIAALTAPAREGEGERHIPYRRSKLTRLLEDSLGGNCRTVFLATVSPSPDCYAETLSTLQFAKRAKHVKNRAKVNEDVSQAALLRRYETELAELHEERARLDALKSAAAEAAEERDSALLMLEKRSKEYLHEKQEKLRLADRISVLESQLLGGGGGEERGEGAAHERVEMAGRIAELERELTEAHGAGSGTKYRQLLVRQRDVMLALTDRLAERDETLLALQAELDAADAATAEARDRYSRVAVASTALQTAVTGAQRVVARAGPAESIIEGVKLALAPVRAPLIDASGQLTDAGNACAARTLQGCVLNSPLRARAPPHLVTPMVSAQPLDTADSLGISMSDDESNVFSGTPRQRTLPPALSITGDELASDSDSIDTLSTLSSPAAPQHQTPALPARSSSGNDAAAAAAAAAADAAAAAERRRALALEAELATARAELVASRAAEERAGAESRRLEAALAELTGRAGDAVAMKARVDALALDCRALHQILAEKIAPGLSSLAANPDPARAGALARLVTMSAAALEKAISNH